MCAGASTRPCFSAATTWEVSWDAGRYLRMDEADAGAYSNNLIVRNPHTAEAERLLIQASHAYEEYMTNVLHWWLR